MTETPNFSEIALYKVALADAGKLQIEMIADALKEMYEKGVEAGKEAQRAFLGHWENGEGGATTGSLKLIKPSVEVIHNDKDPFTDTDTTPQDNEDPFGPTIVHDAEKERLTCGHEGPPAIQDKDRTYCHHCAYL